MKQYILWIGSAALICFFVSCGNSRQEESRDASTGSSEAADLEFTRQVVFLGGAESRDTVGVIEAAVASTRMETNQGLMNVDKLPRNKGMLFIFKDEKPRSFWMANTPLPLDIIFVNESKEIVRIHHSAQPYSQDKYPSGKPARYVIETNGGFCINHDIVEGMSVSF